MSNIITDAERVSELAGLPRSGDRIFILCSENEQFSADAVMALMQFSKAEIVKIPDRVPRLFYLGYFMGRSGLSPENTIILSHDAETKEAAEACGYGTKTGKAAPKTVSAKKPRRKRKAEPAETEADVFTDLKNKTAADSGSIPSAFVRAAEKYGVQKKEMEAVYAAVRDAAEYVSFEIQLQIHVMDRERSAEIYAAAKDHFDELKKAAGDV